MYIITQKSAIKAFKNRREPIMRIIRIYESLQWIL